MWIVYWTELKPQPDDITKGRTLEDHWMIEPTREDARIACNMLIGQKHCECAAFGPVVEDTETWALDWRGEDLRKADLTDVKITRKQWLALAACIVEEEET